jgi:hypothetical protein
MEPFVIGLGCGDPLDVRCTIYRDGRMESRRLENRVLASDEGRGSPLRSFNHSRNYLGQQERNSLLQRPGVLRRRFRGYGEGLTQFASISTCGHPLFHELTVPFQRLRWAILRLYNQIRSG